MTLRRMKQLKAARRNVDLAAAKLDADVTSALMARWARSYKCPHCNTTQRDIKRHLVKCPVLKSAKGKHEGSGPVDPKHPERGRMYKGSYLAALVERRRANPK